MVARRIVVRSRGRSGKTSKAEPKDISLQSWIRETTCSIRGAKDGPTDQN